MKKTFFKTSGMLALAFFGMTTLLGGGVYFLAVVPTAEVQARTVLNKTRKTTETETAIRATTAIQRMLEIRVTVGMEETGATIP